MDELLTLVLDAHGGLERWSGVSALTAHLSLGGPFWGAKGWPDVLGRVCTFTTGQHAGPAGW
jgi:hypothetical protein